MSNSTEIFIKHSESLAIGEDGVKIRVTQPTRSTVARVDIRDIPVVEVTEAYEETVDYAAEAVAEGKKVARDLRTHLRKPFGTRGENIIVANAVKAFHAANLALKARGE